MIRASICRVCAPPTRSKFLSCRKRSSLDWSSGERSPISSRKTVPPSAASSRPGLSLIAPVNEPRTWPKSSLSSRCSLSVVQATSTNGRGLARALLVDIPREQALTGAALAGDQDGRVAPCDLRRGLGHFAAVRSVREERAGRGEPLEPGLERSVLDPQLLQLHRARHDLPDVLGAKRLGNVVARAAAHRLDRVGNRAERGHHDHRQFRGWCA